MFQLYMVTKVHCHEVQPAPYLTDGLEPLGNGNLAAVLRVLQCTPQCQRVCSVHSELLHMVTSMPSLNRCKVIGWGRPIRLYR